MHVVVVVADTQWLIGHCVSLYVYKSNNKTRGKRYGHLRALVTWKKKKTIFVFYFIFFSLPLPLELTSKNLQERRQDEGQTRFTSTRHVQSWCYRLKWMPGAFCSKYEAAYLGLRGPKCNLFVRHCTWRLAHFKPCSLLSAFGLGRSLKCCCWQQLLILIHAVLNRGEQCEWILIRLRAAIESSSALVLLTRLCIHLFIYSK